MRFSFESSPTPRAGRGRSARFICLAVTCAAAALAVPGSEHLRRPSITEARGAIGGLPLYFVENAGQVDGQVAYYLRGRDRTVYFTPQGLTLALVNRAPGAAAGGWAVKLDFVGARGGARPEGLGPKPAVFNYLSGPRERWRTGIRAYEGVIYRELWPGIDLIYGGEGGRMKYQFVVQPGADPELIRLAYRGAGGVKVDGAGRLAVSTPAGEFYDDRPLSYQEVGQEAGGGRVEVGSEYQLRGGEGQAAVYGFRVGDYDRGRALVIDPAMLVSAGYLGGSGEDIGHGIAVDRAGNVYVTGETTSDEISFPGGAGFGAIVGLDRQFGGKSDAFVAKINGAGTEVLYCTYIGGAGNDFGLGIMVDDSGAAYVTGETASDAASFPATRGPDLSFNGGVYDAFVAKLNPEGTGLDYCGYVGGSNDDRGFDIAVDRAGQAYISGTTISPQGTFPVAVGPRLIYSGDNDAFVAKINAAGTALIYCGYIGGFGNDYATGVAVDEAGNAYVGGLTASESNFPVVGGPDLTYNGGGDAFIAKVNPAGSGLDYCGYVGGSGYDLSYGMAVDGAGSAYVTGVTTSDDSSFPDGYGIGAQPASFGSFAGGSDAFVVKVSATGGGFLYAGYLGGSNDETGFGIAVDREGSAHVVGTTASGGAGFPLVGGSDRPFGGGVDAFVTKLNAAGTGLVYSGHIGGDGREEGFDIAVSRSGDAYVTGLTRSPEATFPAVRGPALNYGGGASDAFVARVSTARQLPPAAPVSRPAGGRGVVKTSASSGDR